MLRLIRTDSLNSDFILLVRQLDAYLRGTDGDEADFYAQYNKVDKIRHVIMAYENDQPIACGAIKEYEPGTMEVKRMYTLPECRGRGIAGKVLAELESWAKEMGYGKCILETGKKQPEAIALYHKSSYKLFPNYGQYEGVENSLCFEKILG